MLKYKHLMTPEVYALAHEQVEKGLLKELKDHIAGESQYDAAVKVLGECDDGCSWADAAWVVSKYIELEEACEGTKFFNESKYKSAKKIYADCDNGDLWSDASWAVYEYIDKMDILRSEFGLFKRRKQGARQASDHEEEEEALKS